MQSRDRGFAADRFLACLLFCGLLWLPVLLLELTAPYPWTEVAATPVLRRAFALSGAVAAGIAVVVACTGVAVRGLLLRFAGGRIRAIDTATIAALASALVLLCHGWLKGWTQSTGLPSELLLAGLSAGCAAVAVPIAAVLALAIDAVWPARAAPARSAAAPLVALAGWATALAVELDTSAGPRLGVTLSSWLALAVLCLASRRADAPSRALGRPGWAAVAAAVLLPSAVVLATARPVGEAPPRAAAGEARANVVVVLIDTLRADHMGTGGYALDTTPALDEAATTGATLFSAASAVASATVPSVSALFTSRPPAFGGRRRKDTAWTLARAFAAKGYETAAFISNGLLNTRLFRNGFEQYSVFGGYRYFRDSFLLFDLMAGGERWTSFRRLTWWELHKVSAEDVRARARDWLKREHQRPFFLYVHFVDPHWPYYERGYGLIPESARNLDDAYSVVDLLRHTPRKEIGEHQLRDLLGRYDEEIRLVDESVGALLDDVEELGWSDSTLVVVTADHGEEFFERGAFLHGHDVYQEQLHVPLVFFWPRQWEDRDRRARVEQPVSLADVMPTLIDYLELPPPPQPLLGRSLRPLVEGVEGDAEGNAWHPVRAWDGKGGIEAYREGSMKVRFRRGVEPKVFDLATDPQEANPQSLDEPGVQDFVARAEHYLGRAADDEATAPTDATDAPASDPDERALEELRALGYIE